MGCNHTFFTKKIKIMKTLEINGKKVKCVEDGIKWLCEIVGEGLFFTTHLIHGDELIIEKAKYMLAAKKRYENEPVERL